MSTPIQTLLDLTGRSALVTGGSRGLGLQIAEALGEAGAKILLTSRKAGDLEEAAAHLQDRGIDTRWIAADASQPAEIQRVADEAMQRLGHIDILVNNAGATWGAAMEDYPLEAWDKVMNLNIRSIFLMCQAIGRLSMIPRKHGRIINVASIAGLMGQDPRIVRTIAYNATKGGLVNFTRALAAEWGAHGITVNAICPGFFPSRMTQATLGTTGELIRDWTPTKRLGNDEDLKGLVVLLASEASRHITGQAIAVDGGATVI
jgi:NAD(P)-dependent dehydrogenase (short-subunit alcohol dehydrogenase family)